MSESANKHLNSFLVQIYNNKLLFLYLFNNLLIIINFIYLFIIFSSNMLP